MLLEIHDDPCLFIFFFIIVWYFWFVVTKLAVKRREIQTFTLKIYNKLFLPICLPFNYGITFFLTLAPLSFSLSNKLTRISTLRLCSHGAGPKWI